MVQRTAVEELSVLQSSTALQLQGVSVLRQSYKAHHDPMQYQKNIFKKKNCEFQLQLRWISHLSCVGQLTT